MLKNNNDDFVKAINTLTGDTIFVLKSQLKDIEHKIGPNGEIFIVPKAKKQQHKEGCSPWFFLIFTMIIAGAGAFIIKNEYKANKRHKNVISGIYAKDNKIIISDVNTHEERMVEFNGYKDRFAKNNNLPEFEEQVKLSNVGDTVVFVSSDYEARRKFTLDNKNRLYLNTDSIIARTKKAKQR